ncbi:MAG: hypothetical protein NTY38_22030 [Acidobacteria bacterium]|nr:hypothetical protein [Acidobacteriota bacterium]
MKRLITFLVAYSVWAATLAFSMAPQTTPTGAAKEASGKAKSAAKAGATAAVSDSEIADAKAKGLVWVNLNTKVYHKSGQFYGKTKAGKFMTEADAQKVGYRTAKDSAVTKKAGGNKK